MIPIPVQRIKDAKKPCLATWEFVEQAAMENLSFLVDSPLDMIRPDRLKKALKKLSESTGCNFERLPDFTYRITNKN
jgi:hypothetical protein